VTSGRFERLRWERTAVPAETHNMHPPETHNLRSIHERRLLFAKRVGIPRHPMFETVSAREEAVFLLQAAEEVEHQLIIQRIYAAYSLDKDADDESGVLAARWFDSLIETAVKGMGNLLTIQNLLLCIREQPYLVRANLRGYGAVTPIELEPFSIQLVKRLLAVEVLGDSTRSLQTDENHCDGERLAAIYSAIIWLTFENDEMATLGGYPGGETLPAGRHLAPNDYAPGDELAQRLKTALDWLTYGTMLVLPSPPAVGESPSSIATSVRRALANLARQDEEHGGLQESKDAGPEQSAYWAILEEIEEISNTNPLPVRQVPTNPHTQPQTSPLSPDEGLITHPHSLLIARALDMRYAILLQKTAIGVYTSRSEQEGGASVLQRVVRSITGTTGEMMGCMAPLISKLTLLPRNLESDPQLDAAGAPFSPTVPLGSTQRDRWGNLIGLLDAFKSFVGETRRLGLPAELMGLVEQCAAEDSTIRNLAMSMLRRNPH
jgi:hypothetical protein